MKLDLYFEADKSGLQKTLKNVKMDSGCLSVCGDMIVVNMVACDSSMLEQLHLGASFGASTYQSILKSVMAVWSDEK